MAFDFAILNTVPVIVFPVIHSPNQEPWNEFHTAALFYHKRRTHWLVSRHKVGIAAQRLGSCCVSELRRQWSVRPDPASSLTLYFFAWPLASVKVTQCRATKICNRKNIQSRRWFCSPALGHFRVYLITQARTWCRSSLKWLKRCLRAWNL